MVVARKNVTQEAATARRGHKVLVVAIKDSVATAPRAAAGATSGHARTGQATGNVGSQRSARGAGTHQENEDEVVVVASDSGGQGSVAVADAVIVAAVAQAGDDSTVKVKEMIERLKAENLAMYGEAVVKISAQAHAFLANVAYSGT